MSGSSKLAERATDIDIRDAVLEKFQILLCTDWNGYEERLDFYECRFNSAVALLRLTARRDVYAAAKRLEPLESETEPGEPSPALEKALLRLSAAAAPKGDDFIYRSELLCAISTLPPKEKGVIELMLWGYQFDSKNDKEQTIAKKLGCTEKTARNRRDSAYLKLRAVLGDAEENT